MPRKIVSEQELLQILNGRLQAHDECANCRFTSVVRINEQLADGCNWSTANLRCSGTPASLCAPIASSVIAEVAQTHNLST